MSTTSTSISASSSCFALAATSPFTPTAAPTRSRPRASTAGEYSVARRAPVLVRIPTQSPDAETTGASRCRPACSWSNAAAGGVPAGSVNGSADMTVASCAKRSAPAQSASVTTPTGAPPAPMTTTAPWARLGSSARASPTVSAGPRVIAVSTTRSRVFTQVTTSATTSPGMSWGRIASPPRRATVSAIRRPETAVMFAATTGIVVPLPSRVARSTSRRDPRRTARGP